LVSECREINRAKYTPRPFETSALHRTRIEISWDKTPAERTCWLRDQFKPEADPRSTLTEDRDELEKYVVLSSSGASTAASSDVDEEPPAPTVPRIHRHRPKKMAPEDLRAALLSAIGMDPSRPIESDDEPSGTQMTGKHQKDPSKTNRDCRDDNAETEEEQEEEEEEVFDLNQGSDVEMDEADEQYELGPVEKKVSKHSLVNAQKRSQAGSKTKKVRRRVLPEAMDDEFGDSSASSGAEDPEEPPSTAEKSRKRKYKERQHSVEVVTRTLEVGRLDSIANLIERLSRILLTAM
uniref:SprT-like domain-containing protein n=1 Tax=Echinostoma caproni TaxID=27848 RepID=A0A183BG56_9TREM